TGVIDDSLGGALRYVKIRGDNLDLRSFPDFLILGPQRTGTTWLHAHLRFHPQIFLAEPKELFFFDRLKTPGDRRFASDDLGWYLRFFRDPAWRWALKTGLCLWRHREWYRPRVRGEATASYSVLERDIIGEIRAVKPDIKAIFMIREPVDRAWSHAKKDLLRKRGRKLPDVPAQEFEAFFTDPYQRRCARYVENCDNWAAHLRAGHLLVCFFDDVQTRPEKLLLEVMSFLGVDSHPRYVGRDVRESVNPTEGAKIPEQYRRFLARLLEPDIKRLEERFGVSWPLGEHPLVMRLPSAPGG
ncbi:MAG: hypothetical protein A3J75_00875, partial [Acidobacteria bacterium RBG_16_68_9]